MFSKPSKLYLAACESINPNNYTVSIDIIVRLRLITIVPWDDI